MIQQNGITVTLWFGYGPYMDHIILIDLYAGKITFENKMGNSHWKYLNDIH
jgi:hypothetical protein